MIIWNNCQTLAAVQEALHDVATVALAVMISIMLAAVLETESLARIISYKCSSSLSRDSIISKYLRYDSSI